MRSAIENTFKLYDGYKFCSHNSNTEVGAGDRIYAMDTDIKRSYILKDCWLSYQQFLRSSTSYDLRGQAYNTESSWIMFCKMPRWNSYFQE